MNRENIRRVIDRLNALKSNPRRFNWRRWSSYQGVRAALNPGKIPTPAKIARDRGCGTCACIAGWTVSELKPELNVTPFSWLTSAQQLLELNSSQAAALFYPIYAHCYGLHSSWREHEHELPPQAAAQVLENLLETGKVDWSIIGPRRCFDRHGNEVTT